jgi:hypothetical protein
MNESKKSPRLEGMEDRLERLLNQVTDWVKYEEAKNAALITLDGVGAGMILQWLSVSRQHAAVTPWLTGSMVALLISLLISLSSFYPVTKGKKLRAYIARNRGRPQEDTKQEDTKRGPNILFFYDIAACTPEGYLKDLGAAVEEPAKIQLAYAQEIVTNSQIARLKLRLFEFAFLFSLLGFIVTIGATVAHNF